MHETRRARLESVIKEELSTLLRGIKDPRVPALTITQVQVTQDGSQATVSVSLFGGLLREASPELQLPDQDRVIGDALKGLESASGFLRRKLSGALTVRHVPTLLFKEDRGFANTVRVHELLKQISTPQKSE